LNNYLMRYYYRHHLLLKKNLMHIAIRRSLCIRTRVCNLRTHLNYLIG
jgi:hypothetical protein